MNFSRYQEVVLLFLGLILQEMPSSKVATFLLSKFVLVNMHIRLPHVQSAMSYSAHMSEWKIWKWNKKIF